MGRKFNFSYREDIILIENIKNYPVLYDRSDIKFSCYETRKIVWKEISSRVNRSATDCRKRWRSLRDTFVKSKQGKHNLDVESRSQLNFSIQQYLDFFNEAYIKSRTGYSPEFLYISSTDTESTSTESDLQNNSFSSRKRKLHTINILRKRQKDDTNEFLELEESVPEAKDPLGDTDEQMIEDCDPVLSFFKSMAMTVKTFTPDLIAEAKYRVFHVVNELEKMSLPTIEIVQL
ncbi:uncharacterized protein LOC117608097 isoform X1 [Osmia lignaria lignaria]|uniref:uncharacterized protein LOC117608097 isoform X1 n=1 Tax=Osmia lignaria lignaria TaxID=1437193 RepID=UPI00402B46DD